jgi:2',3'-cyclic-nucleotide 2'-phosphodiesterase / 3'-nucleotidase / 5'-nucleotidase
MKTHTYLSVGIAALLACGHLEVGAAPAIKLHAISTLAASTPNEADASAAEIVAHDPETQRIFVVNAAAALIDVYVISDPANPRLFKTIDVSPYGAVANSVAIKNGVVAIAVEADPKTSPGQVVFVKTSNLKVLANVAVGAQPDMVTFTADGSYVLTANEGEPSAYTGSAGTDPEGSVSIIDVSGGFANLTQGHVQTAGFGGFSLAALTAAGVRIFGPGATVAQDLEPEYVATSEDSQTAWVTLQENNALAIIDIPTATVLDIVALGTKDHSLAANPFDPSNSDGGLTDANLDGIPDGIKIRTWPVKGLYQPDAIAAYTVDGQSYLVLANEGEARTDWPGYSERRLPASAASDFTVNAAAYALDPTVFPNAATLKQNANLGRLQASKASGDTDGDGDFDEIHSFGARSFSIRAATGALVWDSGSQFEEKVAATYPSFFNASNSNNTFESRSASKGPEPEGVAIGKIADRTYAFIGLERVGGVMVYDITDPAAPVFQDYVNNRDFAKAITDPNSGDLGPEGLAFISADNSPNGKPLVVVANEVSGTTTIFEVNSYE